MAYHAGVTEKLQSSIFKQLKASRTIKIEHNFRCLYARKAVGLNLFLNFDVYCFGNNLNFLSFSTLSIEKFPDCT